MAGRKWPEASWDAGWKVPRIRLGRGRESGKKVEPFCYIRRRPPPPFSTIQRVITESLYLVTTVQAARPGSRPSPTSALPRPHCLHSPPPLHPPSPLEPVGGPSYSHPLARALDKETAAAGGRALVLCHLVSILSKRTTGLEGQLATLAHPEPSHLSPT
jgi:hypothetical protein